MVRTLDSGTRASGAKAPRKGISNPATPVGSSSKANIASSGGGNPVCPRETPTWQKSITNFFNKNNCKKDDNNTDKQSVEIEESGESSKAYKKVIDLPETSQDETEDDEVKHIDKKIKISSDDTDGNNKKCEVQDDASSDEEIPKKKKFKPNELLQDSD